MEEYSSALKVGSILEGRYRIEEVLGEGGFGVVYYALDGLLDRYVALKECLPCDFALRAQDNTTVYAKTKSTVSDFEWAKERFVEEAKILVKFRNKNLLSANNIFRANGTVYMDSDFIKGLNLEDILQGNRICTEEFVLNVFTGVLNGLRDVHSEELMHRDIKPANIIISEENSTPVLIDFGSARMAVNSKTKPLTAMVSQGYAPLEQYYEDGNQGAWTDIYSLAAVCYKMIVGAKPAEAVARIRNDSIIKLAESYKGKYKDNLLRVLDMCLLMDETKRPQSVEAVLSILEGEGSIAKEAELVASGKAKILLPELKPLSDIDNEFSSSRSAKSKKMIIALSSVVVFAILLLILFSTVTTSSIEVKYDYSARKDKQVESAKDLYQQGVAYYYGDNGVQDYKKAVEFFSKAAELGDSEAQCMLAICYAEGEGVAKNLSEAVKWYKKSAELGYANAQFMLGTLYFKGEGVAKNLSEALKWYKKSAEQDNSSALCLLGFSYYYGLGVDRDYFQAQKYYRKSAELGDSDAQYGLGLCYYTGNGVSQNYPEAVKWFRKSAELGDSDAQYGLGLCYYTGNGVTQNYTYAVKWFRKSAEEGNAEAQYYLGACYYDGDSVTQNYAEAVKWFRKSAEQGDPDAQYRLGLCYYKGEGVSKNIEEAKKWFRKSAEQGHSKAKEYL